MTENEDAMTEKAPEDYQLDVNDEIEDDDPDFVEIEEVPDAEETEEPVKAEA